MSRTPNRFPGLLEAEDGFLLYSGSTHPTINGEVRYITGKGFEFEEEGVTKTLGGISTDLLGDITSSISASHILVNPNSTLLNSRVLSGGSGITITDNGAGSTIVVSLDSVGGFAQLNGNNNFTGTNIFSNGMSGSLTKLSDGTSYLNGGSNIIVTSESNGSITISLSGNIVTDHNTLTGLQGGTTNQYYHLTSTEYSKVQTLSSSYADKSASYVVLSTTSSLDNERVLGVGSGLKLTDGGAGSTIAITIDDSVLATVSGTTFTGPAKFNQGLSGSLTTLIDGSSYLKAGSNISITSASNGSITVTNTLTSLSASAITTNTTYFTGSLSSSDTNVQLALETLCNKPSVGVGAGPLGTESITFNTSSITVGDCDVHLYNNPNFTNQIKRYKATGGTFSIADQTLCYIVGDYNSGSVIQRLITNVEEINESNIVPIYTLWRSGSILHTLSWDSIGYGMTNRMHQRLVKTQRYLRESGLVLSEGVANNIIVSPGIVWIGAVRKYLNEFNTSIIPAKLLSTNGSGGWNIQDITTYNNTQYDTGTGLALLGGGNNHWTVNWIYRAINDGGVDQDYLAVVLGRQDFLSLASAAASAAPSTLPSVITSHSVLVGRIIAKKEIVPAAQIDSAFTVTLGSSGISDHNVLSNLQGGTTNQYYHLTSTEYSKVQNLSSSYADINSSYIVLNATSSLPNERVLTIGTGINVSDSGPGSNVSLSINNNVVATISGSTFTGAVRFNQGLSGSLTTLTDGTSYLKAGSNISITSASNGSITIQASTGSTSDHNHNSLSGLQGGTTNQYYHLTSNELNHVQSTLATLEPMGFETLTTSEILYNSGSRTLTLQPKSPATSFDVYIKGYKQTITSSLSVIHGTSSGDYYCYFDLSGSFQVSTVNTPWSIANTAQCAIIVYNSGNTPSGFVLEERHGTVMSWADHLYNHTTRGSQYLNGFSIGDYTYATGPTSNANNTYTLTEGNFADEDLRITVSQLLNTGNPYTIFYRSGISGEWVWKVNQTVPYSFGTTYIHYNQNNAGKWQLTELTDNTYCNYFIFATSSQNAEFRYIIIPGQNKYSSAAAAQSGETASSLSYGSIPFPELVPLYQIVFRARSIYTATSGRCRIELIPIKFVAQNISLSISGGATSHSSLSNRSDVNSHPAAAISTSTSYFTGSSILTSTDIDVQTSLESLGIKSAAISGSTFTGVVRFNQGLSGSLTQLIDGTSYLKAGTNVTITSASNGSVTISSTGGSSGGGADVDASYIVLNATSSLPNERALTAGTGIRLIDAGVGSTATLSINDNIVATVSGTTFTGAVKFNSGLSGSLTTLTDGTSYLKAGNNIKILSQSNGSIILSNSLEGFTQNYISSGGNTALGVSAFNASTSGLGTYNTAVGYKAGYNSPSTNYNCYYGAFAGWTSNGSNNNVAIGYQAMYNSVGATNFTVIGSQAAPYAQNSSNLVAIGYRAYQSAPYGVNLKTVVIGGQTAIGISGGDCIVAVGQYAGYNYSGGVYDSTGCTLLGADTGFRYNTIVNNSFAVGRGAVVATSSVGVLGSVAYPVKVGINMEAPTAFLQLPSGTMTTAPLKLMSGSLTSTPQSGSIEYDATNLYITDQYNIRNRLTNNTRLGTSLLDFGTGALNTTASVGNITDINQSSFVQAYMMADTTINKTSQQHTADSIRLVCGNIINNSGFTIYASSSITLSGTYSVRWNVYNPVKFEPMSYPGLAAYYDCDTLGYLLNGSTISTLYDQSFNNDASGRNAVQSTALSQPTLTAIDSEFLNHGTTTFSSNKELDTGTWTTSHQVTTDYYVVKLPPTKGASSYYNLIDGFGTNRHSFSYGPGTTVSMYAGAQVVSSTVAVNTIAVICAVYNTTNSAIYLNNSTTPIGTGNCGSQTFSRISIGNYEGNYPFTGKVACIAIYSGVHSSAMRAEIMKKLGQKYGITVTA